MSEDAWWMAMQAGPEPGSMTWNAAGVYNFRVPGGVTRVKVSATGASGGGGGGGASNFGGLWGRTFNLALTLWVDEDRDKPDGNTGSVGGAGGLSRVQAASGVVGANGGRGGGGGPGGKAFGATFMTADKSTPPTALDPSADAVSTSFVGGGAPGTGAVATGAFRQTTGSMRSFDGWTWIFNVSNQSRGMVGPLNSGALGGRGEAGPTVVGDLDVTEGEMLSVTVGAAGAGGAGGASSPFMRFFSDALAGSFSGTFDLSTIAGSAGSAGTPGSVTISW